jgi:2,3-bisphosphoglycerate-independent phosphoglycerate mutase
MDQKFLQKFIQPAQTKIVMIILDGLGGLPLDVGGKTELETAYTPNLDALAARSDLGLSVPVGPGITPGSGPGHLALFGYDPIQTEIGRGILEALGVDFDLGPEDVAARGNFCTVDASGILTDRRAGRIATEASTRLVERLQTIRLEGVEVSVRAIREHRFAFVLRGPGLDDALTDLDPQKTGVPLLPARALRPEAEWTASLANRFVEQASELLRDQPQGNHVTLRGFARYPLLASFQERYRLRAAAIAAYGMYRGVARLVSMQLVAPAGCSLEEEFAALEKNWPDFDFFYLHVKKTDTSGELGDFDGKVRAIEEVDAFLPRVMALQPEVVIVTGDHSTPSRLKAHSWHPVPALLYSSSARANGIAGFGETACARGSLGLFPAKDLMPLALAHAGRIAKYGA